MSRSNRLRPACDVAERREKEAAGELARARAALGQAQARVDELRRFHGEYAQRLASTPGGALQSAVLLKDGHAFQARVQLGIDQAERQLQEQHRVCEACHARWVDCRMRARAIDKLAQRHLAQERRQAESIEQRDQDEFAGRVRR